MSDGSSFDDEFNVELKRLFASPEGTAPRNRYDGPLDWPSSEGTMSLRDRVLGAPGLPRSKTPLVVAGFVLVVLALIVVGAQRNAAKPATEVSTDALEPDPLPGTTTTTTTTATTTTAATQTAPSNTSGFPRPPELPSTTSAPSSTAVPTTRTPPIVAAPTTRRPSTSATTEPTDSTVETTTIPATVPRIPVTAFLDDFTGETSEQPTSWRAEKGTWLIKSDGDTKVLRNEGAGPTETTIVTTGNDTWTEYETDARLRPGAGTTMGIAAMYHGENGHYLCQVDRAKGRLELWKVVDGLRGRIGDESYVVPSDGSVWLSFTVRKGQLTCRGNDDPNAPSLVTTDSKFTTGKLAIVSTGPGDIRRIEVKA